MKNMKKLLSILLVLLMLSSMFPAAFAEEETGESAPAEEADPIEEAAPAVQIIIVEAPETDGEAADVQSAESGEAPATGEAAEAKTAETGEAGEVRESADSEADSEETETDPAAQSDSEPAAAETEAAGQDETAEAESAPTDPAAEAEAPQDDSSAEAAVTDAEVETQNASGSAGTDHAVQKEGELSEKTINIQSWDIQKMATNPDYSYLTFTFSSEEDSTVYEAYIAGIKIEPASDTEDYNRRVTELVTKVVDLFYADINVILSDSGEFVIENGLSVQPIDAEKIHPTETADHPDTDNLLCWAASASDMLQFTGWSKVAVGETFASEDQVFDYFEESFTDAGSSQEHAIKWFFNGAYPHQAVNTATGEIIYGSTGGDSQEKLTSGKNGNVLSDYAEECFEKHYTSETDGYGALYDAALGLKDGTATGLTVNFYGDDGTRADSGHALTLLGYIRNTLQTGWESLKALFISDSDNNKNVTQTREAAVNSVNMYQLEENTVEGYTGPVQVLSLKGYSLFYDDTRITGFCTLAPYTAGAAKEQTGSKDAVQQIDFTVEYIHSGYETPSDIKIGDSLKFCTSVLNNSYTTLNTANEPYCKVTYTVRCNGEVVATPTFTYKVAGIYGSNMGANGANYYETENAYTPTRAGNYTVSVTVDGIYYRDENGNEVPIPEAYTLNNSSLQPCSFTVTGGDTTEPTPEPTPDQPDDSGSDDTAPDEPANSISVPVWSAIITGSADSETGIELKGVYGTGLTLMKNGKVVPAENYTLTFADNGSVIVTFTQDYIDTLLPGVHVFQVLDGSGSLIGIIELTVR